MRTFRLIGMTLLMIILTVNFTACSDDDDNELSLPVDNTLELLIGTWEGTGEVEGEILTFNKDNTHTKQSEDYTQSGTFEYFPNRYMFVTYYTNDWGQGDWKEENIIYTIVKITEDELILNNNGHSDIIIFKRK